MKNLGYSQNFLVNKKLVERLISKSNIDVTDYVIEIGPGKGTTLRVRLFLTLTIQMPTHMYFLSMLERLLQLNMIKNYIII